MAVVALAETSELLSDAGFSHGFFTRQGGVSPEPWASLNFFSGNGDDVGRVAENLRRAARFLGADPARVYFLSQVHGTTARVLYGDEVRTDVLHDQGDITLSQRPGVACGVRMADCATVLIGDRRTGAVAAVHAGWRGVVAEAAPAGVRALRELLGGPGDLVAAVGPHIGPCCFEVGEDVATTLERASLVAGVVDRGGNKPHVDLRTIIDAQLHAAEVTVDHVGGCTRCGPARYHSYRRDGAVSGRMLAAIVAR
ncbi:MAG: polyphenol oxidase family protein [Myxococcota bacterium]